MALHGMPLSAPEDVFDVQFYVTHATTRDVCWRWTAKRPVYQMNPRLDALQCMPHVKMFINDFSINIRTHSPHTRFYSYGWIINVAEI